MNRLSSLASSDSSPKQLPKELHFQTAQDDSAVDRPADTTHEKNAAGLPYLLTQSAQPKMNRPRAFFLPVRYESGYRYPLVVWLHSDGYNEHQIGHVLPHISKQNYVGVGIRGSMALDASGRRFGWSHAPAAIARCEDSIWQAVDEACERYSIHCGRVFLAGYGEGGTMARRVALQRSSQFAGCVTLGGRLPRGGAVLSNLVAARELKNFWAVATRSSSLTQDQFDDDIRLAADARLRLDVRRYTTDDEMVTEVLGDVNAWMMRIVTGEPLPEPVSQDWATTAVQFSSN